jgi:hypothetical protein
MKSQSLVFYYCLGNLLAVSSYGSERAVIERELLQAQHEKAEIARRTGKAGATKARIMSQIAGLQTRRAAVSVSGRIEIDRQIADLKSQYSDAEAEWEEQNRRARELQSVYLRLQNEQRAAMAAEKTDEANAEREKDGKLGAEQLALEKEERRMKEAYEDSKSRREADELNRINKTRSERPRSIVKRNYRGDYKKESHTRGAYWVKVYDVQYSDGTFGLLEVPTSAPSK